MKIGFINEMIIYNDYLNDYKNVNEKLSNFVC